MFIVCLWFLKGPFLVIHFFCYTLMAFLMISIIFLFILKILLSTLSRDFDTGKTQLVSFDQSKSTGAIDGKMCGSVLKENNLLRSWGQLYLLNWIGALTLTLLLKLSSRKSEPWFAVWSFFPLRLFCISINLLNGHAWNTAAMSRLVPLVATWDYWISYKNGYTRLLVLQRPLEPLAHCQICSQLKSFL